MYRHTGSASTRAVTANHLATRFGMDKENFKALLIAGNLAQYQYRGGGYILHSGGSVGIILAWALLLRLVP